MKKILIITKPSLKKEEPFKKEAKEAGLDVELSTFSDISYSSLNDGRLIIKANNKDLKEFDLIYIRVVGQFFETASIVVDYARKNKIKLVDKMYQKSKFIRLPLAKGLESKLLIDAKIPHPKTIFGTLEKITSLGEKRLGYPFVIKGTNGKQGNAVWSPRDKTEKDELLKVLLFREEKGEKFLVQELIRSSIRARVLVIGGKSKAGIIRPTRWRKRFGDREVERKNLIDVPRDMAKLSEKACKILGIDIGGVDVLKDDKTKKLYILEVNSAPRWSSVKSDTGLNVEREILKFIKKTA